MRMLISALTPECTRGASTWLLTWSTGHASQCSPLKGELWGSFKGLWGLTYGRFGVDPYKNYIGCFYRLGFLFVGVLVIRSILGLYRGP